MHNEKSEIHRNELVEGTRKGRGLYRKEKEVETNRFWSVLPLSGNIFS